MRFEFKNSLAGVHGSRTHPLAGREQTAARPTRVDHVFSLFRSDV